MRLSDLFPEGNPRIVEARKKKAAEKAAAEGGGFKMSDEAEGGGESAGSRANAQGNTLGDRYRGLGDSSPRSGQAPARNLHRDRTTDGSGHSEGEVMSRIPHSSEEHEAKYNSEA